MKKRILFVRTHKTLNAGGPVPPLGILYIASAVMGAYKDAYEIKICHFEVKGFSINDLKDETASFSPQIVGISAMTCEFDLAQATARIVKEHCKETVVIIGGPHASLAKERILENRDFDFVVIGEGERTFVDLLNAVDKKNDLARVNGICYRSGSGIHINLAQPYIEDLDNYSVSSAAWGLIDLKEYSCCLSWNGINKEKLYAPVVTSRGCPFQCSFCRSRAVFGKVFRARSPENVFNEIADLYNNHRVREIHIFDDVFNFDADRVKEICRSIIKSGLKIGLAFPNGLRADLMSEDLIRLLRQAGAYKINYGIETVNAHCQTSTRKELDIKRTEGIINMTASAGIIASGYFIMGLPDETIEDMRRTVDFAIRSNLHNAYFFKFADFSRSETGLIANNELHFHYIKDKASKESKMDAEINKLIFEAQQGFYLNFNRILRLFLRTNQKIGFLKNVAFSFALMLRVYLERELGQVSKK